MVTSDRKKATATWSTAAGAVVFAAGYLGILFDNGLCMESSCVWNSVLPYFVVATAGIIVLAAGGVLRSFAGSTRVGVAVLLVAALGIVGIDWASGQYGGGDFLPIWTALLPVLVAVGMLFAGPRIQLRAKAS
jgi:hypothetical protein